MRRTDTLAFFLVAIAFVLGQDPAAAQDAGRLQFERVPMAGEPPVTALWQGADGFLWIGTVDGLHRHDGYAFTAFRHSASDPTSISNNYINVNGLAGDARGHLWIGTRDGLNRLDPATGVFTRYRAGDDSMQSPLGNLVTAVLPAPDGPVWAGTARGLYRLEPGTDRLMPFDAGPAARAPVLDLIRDRRGRIWAASYAGLLMIDEAAETHRWFTHDPAAADGLPPGRIHAVFEDRSGRIWVGTDAGLLARCEPGAGTCSRFDPKQGADHGDEPHFVLDIYEDRAGRIWAALWDYGLVVLDPDRGDAVRYHHDPAAPYSLPGDRPSVAFEDRTGLVWVGTWDGLAKVRPARAFRHVGAETLGAPRATSVEVGRSGHVWVGTQGGRVVRLDTAGRRVRAYRHTPGRPASPASDQIASIAEDDDGRLWIGTEGAGLDRLDPRSGAVEHFRFDPADPSTLGSDFVYKVFLDRRRRLWVGTTNGGLNLFDRERNRFVRYRHDPGDSTTLSIDEVWTVYEDRHGGLWIGTIGGGVDRLVESAGDPASYAFRRYGPAPSPNVVSFYEDPAGTLWVGAMGGLSRYDRENDRFTPAGVDALADDNAGCILGDDRGALWIGTSNGLVRFDPRTGEATRYDERDGLVNRTFFFDGCDRDAAGRLYFAGREGLTAFHPAKITRNRMPPRVVLTGAYLFNEPARLDSSIAAMKIWTLPHHQNTLTFEFAALDFTIPSKNRYRYRMRGVDRDWVMDRGDRTATYPNLPPGRYRFIVEATNNDGMWSEQPASLLITITPAFWQTWWFWLLLVLIFLSIPLGFLVNRRQQRRRLEQTRRRIAANLHDSVGSSLSGFGLYMDALRRKTSLSDADRARIEEYGRQARRLVADLRDIVWIVDAGFDRMQDVLQRMRQAAEQLSAGVSLSYSAPDEVPEVALSMEKRQDLFLLYKEALHNAARHARATSIAVRITIDGRRLVIEVEDDGVGFDVDHATAGHGLTTMRQRAANIGATLDIDSRPGAGTTIRVTTEMT